MRFAIYSGSGLGLSWWKRLQDEGHQVLVYIEEKPPQRVGDGIIPKTQNFAQWIAWGRQDPKCIFFFDISSAGDKADALRKQGCLVVGGCKFFDRLEAERDWSQSLHESIGILHPESKSFSTIGAARSYARSNKKPHVFKSNKYLDASATYMSEGPEDMDRYLEYIQHRYGDNISNILQEKLDGFALSTARWWNGRAFVGPFEATVEHKKFLNNDKGSATGCQFNCIWFYQDEYPALAEKLHWNKLDDVFRKYEAAPGLYDINALLSEKDGEAYFLESTPRLGYDSETTSQKGISELGKFLYNLAVGLPVDDLFNKNEYFDSIKLSVSPYPYEAHLKEMPYEKTCIDIPVFGYDGLWAKHFIGYGLRFDSKMGLVTADPSGWLGLSSAKGTDPLKPFDDCYKFVDKVLKVPNLQYRTDAKDRVEQDLDTIEGLGFDIR
jgi:phosphoribosylamine--glycine ligase